MPDIDLGSFGAYYDLCLLCFHDAPGVWSSSSMVMLGFCLFIQTLFPLRLDTSNFTRCDLFLQR
jgi:hypothetical protein